jgi:tRNA-specific 2-thiouridylase
VVAIRPESREVVVGSVEELAGQGLRLDELNWLVPALEPGDTCQVQIRYRSRPVPATIVAQEGDSLSLTLANPVRAITPGQSGVLYGAGGQLLGGGVIG